MVFRLQLTACETLRRVRAADGILTEQDRLDGKAVLNYPGTYLGKGVKKPGVCR